MPAKRYGIERTTKEAFAVLLRDWTPFAAARRAIAEVLEDAIRNERFPDDTDLAYIRLQLDLAMIWADKDAPNA